MKTKSLQTIGLIWLFVLIVSNISFADPFGTNLGNFNGVTCYSNGTTGYFCNNCYNYYNGTNTGITWQCVEFVNRYYAQIYNMAIRNPSANANNYFSTASARGLTSFANGTNTRPQIGDIICSDGGTYGHIAIIRNVSSNNDYVDIIQQNWYNNSNDLSMRVNMTYSNGNYIISNIGTSYPVQGWLRKPTTISASFTVNGYSVSGWNFWKYGPAYFQTCYSVTMNISNLPSGYHWALFSANSSGVIDPIITNQSGTSYTFTFAVSSTNGNYPNGANYSFWLLPQGATTNPWVISPTFRISTLPVLTITSTPSPMYAGLPATVNWVVSGGVPGLPDGGWTGNIRLQWHKNNVPLPNLASVPVANHTYTFVVPSTISGGTIPGCDFKISGSNAATGTTIPDGYVYAFTPEFCIYNPSGITNISNDIPTKFYLKENYPNPFNPKTKIKFAIAKEGEVKIVVYDVRGREIQSLVNESLKPGLYDVFFDGSKYTSGVYLYKIIAGDYTETKKMLMVK